MDQIQTHLSYYAWTGNRNTFKKYKTRWLFTMNESIDKFLFYSLIIVTLQQKKDIFE